MLETDHVDYGRVECKVNAKSTAPEGASKGTNGLGSIPWLKLNATVTTADAAPWAYNEVYRIHTAGGMAPKDCSGIEGSFTVEYSAQYWFYA
jgi:hypothetical protein